MELNKVLEFTKDAIRTNLAKWAYKDECVLLEALEMLEAYQKGPSNTQIQTGACQCKYPYPDTIHKFDGFYCAACNLPRR